MMNEHRRQLLKLLSKTEQAIAEAEAISVEPADDKTLQQVSSTLAELREAREDIERKLRATE
jgi:hypothetical protein